MRRIEGIGTLLGRLLVVAIACFDLSAQEASAGFSMPVTLTGGAIHASQPLATESESDASASGAMFRATLYPGLKLGDRWFVYSAVQIGTQPGPSYSGGGPGQALQARLLQAFVGYNWTVPGRSLTLKAGKLPSAFGSFSQRYDDMANPLLASPLSYASPVLIRADQLPCGAGDFLDQAEMAESYGRGTQPGVHFRCGGAKSSSGGLLPVSLYGLPGAQMDISWGKVDARFQIANSSPANPQSLLSSSQALQWAAGSGYTVRPGFRIGFSMHRGPFLDDILTTLLPDQTRASDYPATGVGSDVQWSRGRWNLEAEWQRFQYDYPKFVVSPVASSGYLEITRTLSPRFYVAARMAYQLYNRIADLRISTSEPFLPKRQTSEFAIGYRPNSRQLLKVGVTWLQDGMASPVLPGTSFGFQLVTVLPPLSRPLR
jgi:hypothetical protein